MKLTSKVTNYSRPLFASALITGSLFQLIAPAFANPVAPTIKNQATATYEDPENPADPTNPNDPNRINAASNIVEVTIQEVAGITVQQKGITDVADAPVAGVQGGDVVYFRFDVTNTGNDGTKIFIPGVATVSANGTAQTVQYFDETTKTWKDVPASGFTTGNVAKDGVVKVRVTVKIDDTASEVPVTVSLGKTTEPNLQNQERTVPVEAQDVFTIDNADGANGEIMGMPVNGTREAMDSQLIKVAKRGSLLNGPLDKPAATGENGDNNKDFTNKSTAVAPGIKKGDKFDPTEVGFKNTVKNVTDTPSDIKVVPTVKADETLPEGTKVTLKDPKKPNDPGVVFIVTGGKFVPVDPTKPTLVLPQVPGQGTAEYTTIIDLPAGTEALKGYPVELIAFIDRNNDNLPGINELKNTTIDRAYTGFTDMLKESRTLDVDGKPLNTFSVDSKAAKPGQFIEYRIKFNNISTVVPAGSDSKGLSAANFTITEDGKAGVNNWGDLTTNVPSSATASMGALTFSPANDTTNPAVKVYTNNAGTVAPQTGGTFSFTRQLNKQFKLALTPLLAAWERLGEGTPKLLKINFNLSPFTTWNSNCEW